MELSIHGKRTTCCHCYVLPERTLQPTCAVKQSRCFYGQCEQMTKQYMKLRLFLLQNIIQNCFLHKRGTHEQLGCCKWNRMQLETISQWDHIICNTHQHVNVLTHTHFQTSGKVLATALWLYLLQYMSRTTNSLPLLWAPLLGPYPLNSTFILISTTCL